MTNKRFIFELVEISDVDNDKLVEVITDKEKNYSYDELDEVVGLLNNIHQENQQLKHYKLYEDNKRLQTIIADLKEENEQLRQKIKHCVYVDVDNENGCMNCKYDEGSICSILNCGTHDYLEGVSECGLKYWEYKEDE